MVETTDPSPKAQQAEANTSQQLIKTKNQEKNEAKRKAKMEKFLAKQNKLKDSTPASSSSTEKKKKETTPKVKPKPTPISFVPGEKKDLSAPMLDAYEPSLVEVAWYDWWVKEKFFEPRLTPEGKIPPEGKFVVATPPPNVTGRLHIGHALGVSIQDSLARWNRMKGLSVLLNPGADHAGISTQSVVEKMLWKNQKVTRHDLGRDAFVEKVWEWKEEYGHAIFQQQNRLGGSYDWSRDHFTLDSQLSKAVMETFVRLWDDGIIYRAKKLVNWCVYFKTALSNLEVDNVEIPGKTLISVPGYDKKVEFGVLVLFSYPVEDSDEKIVVATTRVETMLADVAVAVHPDDPRYKHLHGKSVIHPFNGRKLPIVTDADFVDPAFGTGAVKITPAHDFNDYVVGNRHNLPFINLLNDDGTYNHNADKFEGQKRFDVRSNILKELEELGLLVEIRDNPMTIPKCTKSGDIIEPLIKPQWYVSCETLAPPAMEAVRNGELKIIPKTSEGDWFRWLGKIEDWCISRQLWWGHRIPAYFVNVEGEVRKEDDSNMWVCGRDFDEAVRRAEAKFPGKKFTLEQDEDVLDTWFSSGLWPFSLMGWPEETFDFERFYPTTLNETGWDILFFWIARMVMLGLRLTGKVPFNKVFCHAMIRDAHGRKMSKSLGNVIDPIDVIEGIALEELHKKLESGNLDPRELKIATAGQKKDFPNGIPECGTDALRFALCSYTSTGRDLNLNVLRIEGYRKFCNKLWNATKFALSKLGSDFKPNPTMSLSGDESIGELWILDRLNTAIVELNKNLTEMNFMAATNSIYSFWLYELCDVYIEYTKYITTEKGVISASNTLYTCLDQGLRMLHPFMPFITEELWQRLPRRPNDSTPSITIAEFPTEVPQFSNSTAKEQFDLVLSIIKAARSTLVNYSITSNATLYIASTSESESKIYTSSIDQIKGMIKGCTSISILSQADSSPSGCAVSIVSPTTNLLLLVKGRIDISSEIERLNKKLEKSKGSYNLLRTKVSAPGYEKTNPDIKEASNTKLKTFEEEISAIESVISSFQKLEV
ncbi:hypothetical protein BB560_000377 [Smittium megazygosporum]|uniref:Probable valine--tRNA ligase, cytoplasmic n=1 Tax=Smittium megazygosporum TaxID=133381 RepID=A0A2T9ZKK0_9FUNG|nr:hypothetical protein BB560_000377 [Smittium megazygosporum]